MRREYLNRVISEKIILYKCLNGLIYKETCRLAFLRLFRKASSQISLNFTKEARHFWSKKLKTVSM